jgi:L-lactate dehydrogenase complex protein LldG
MNVSASKENILKKIRKALSNSTPLPFPNREGSNSIYHPAQQELEIEFAEQCTRLQGKFIYCLDTKELAVQLNGIIQHNQWTKIFCCEDKLAELLKNDLQISCPHNDLASCDASITSCEFLIARTGTIVLSAAQQSGRTVSVYAPIHICIAYTSQLVYDIKDGLQLLKEKYPQSLPSLITFATGPSRTADIEKTLVVGVHGPKEVYVFLVDSKQAG